MAGLTGAVAVLMAHLVGVPRAVLALHPLFCMLALSLSRMAYRMVTVPSQLERQAEAVPP